MKYRAPNPNCKCGQPRRPHGRYCQACHAAKQKVYRARMRAEIKGSVYAEAVRKAKMRILLAAIREERGNLCAAAVRLGIHRNTISRAMREVGLTAQQVKQYIREDALKKEAA